MFSESHPWNIEYRAYRRGFIQDRHNALGSELDLLIDYFIDDPKVKKDVGHNIHLKAEKLHEFKVISDDIYADLNNVRKARNEFVKAVGEP